MKLQEIQIRARIFQFNPIEVYYQTYSKSYLHTQRHLPKTPSRKFHDETALIQIHTSGIVCAFCSLLQPLRGVGFNRDIQISHVMVFRCEFAFGWRTGHCEICAEYVRDVQIGSEHGMQSQIETQTRQWSTRMFHIAIHAWISHRNFGSIEIWHEFICMSVILIRSLVWVRLNVLEYYMPVNGIDAFIKMNPCVYVIEITNNNE